MIGFLYSVFDKALQQTIVMSIHSNDKEARTNFEKVTKDLDAKNIELWRLAGVDTEENTIVEVERRKIANGKNRKRTAILQQDESGAST